MPKVRNYSQKRQKKYSRSGCAECKKSHLKCDEQTPICGRCLKRQTLCHYATVENKELNLPGMQVMDLEEANAEALTRVGLVTAETSKITAKTENRKAPNTNIIRTRFPIITSAGSAARASSANASASSSGKINFNTSHGVATSTPITSAGSMTLTPTPTTITTAIQSQINTSPLAISIFDLVFIQPHEAEILNSQTNNGNSTPAQTIDPKHNPNRNLFTLSWKYRDVIDFISVFNQYDPLVPGNNPHFPSDVSLNEPLFLDFVWSLSTQTKFFFILPLFPDETYNELLDVLLVLGRVYPIVQSIMSYDCSMLMKQLYNANDLPERAEFWDGQVRLRSFKQCLDILSERIERSTSFSEYSVMSFSVLILFCANCSDETWRTHFRGCQQLLKKAEKLSASAEPNSDLDQAALKLLNLTVCWFHGAQVFAKVSTNEGCEISNVGNSLSRISSESSKLSVIPENGITLMFGFSNKVIPVLDKLCNCLHYLKGKFGLNLCGSNMLKYHLTKQRYKNLEHHVNQFGFELLQELANIMDDYQRVDFQDFRRNITLKNIEKLQRLGLELYINYFFIGSQSVESVQDKLLVILEMFISTPYHSTAGSVTHWVLYISAIISLLLGQNDIYNEFIDCFITSNKNGIYSVEKTLNRLEYIKKCLTNNAYDDIVDPQLDSILI